MDAERSQCDAQLWSGASQVIADDGMLAIRIDAVPSHEGETPSEGLTKSSCEIET